MGICIPCTYHIIYAAISGLKIWGKNLVWRWCFSIKPKPTFLGAREVLITRATLLAKCMTVGCILLSPALYTLCCGAWLMWFDQFRSFCLHYCSHAMLEHIPTAILYFIHKASDSPVCRGYYMVVRRYQCYFRVVKTIFYERAQWENKIHIC